MWKRILVALLVIVLAVTADAVYQEVERVAGATFNIRLGGLLYDLRPVIFIIWNLFIVNITRWFITSEHFSALPSLIFIIFGLIVLSETTFPQNRNLHYKDFSH